MYSYVKSRLESLQIARPRFRKFTISYIGNIKIACPISQLQDTNFPDWHKVVNIKCMQNYVNNSWNPEGLKSYDVTNFKFVQNNYLSWQDQESILWLQSLKLLLSPSQRGLQVQVGIQAIQLMITQFMINSWLATNLLGITRQCCWPTRIKNCWSKNMLGDGWFISDH